MILVTSDITMAEGYVEGNPGTSGAMPTLHVNSDSIETLALQNTTAIVAVINQSKMADGDDMPEDAGGNRQRVRLLPTLNKAP